MRGWRGEGGGVGGVRRLRGKSPDGILLKDWIILTTHLGSKPLLRTTTTITAKKTQSNKNFGEAQRWMRGFKLLYEFYCSLTKSLNSDLNI